MSTSPQQIDAILQQEAETAAAYLRSKKHNASLNEFIRLSPNLVRTINLPLDVEGNRFLHLAADALNAPIIDHLVAVGADVTAQTTEGEFAFCARRATCASELPFATFQKLLFPYPWPRPE